MDKKEGVMPYDATYSGHVSWSYKAVTAGNVAALE